MFSVAAAGASVLLISTAASLALRRPAVQVFNVRVASAFMVAYSIDPPTTFEPLDPAVIDAALRDAQPGASVRAVTLALVPVETQQVVVEVPALVQAAVPQ